MPHMGAWGTGNLDGDSPRDFLADMVGRWERIVDRTLAGEPTEVISASRFAPGFEALDGGILPTVEILIAVAEKLPCDHVPGLPKVARWSSQALRIYDAEVDRWDPDEGIMTERRAMIDATFAHLAELVANREDDADSACGGP